MELVGEEVPSIIEYKTNLFAASGGADMIKPFTPPFARLQKNAEARISMNEKGGGNIMPGESERVMRKSCEAYSKIKP